MVALIERRLVELLVCKIIEDAEGGCSECGERDGPLLRYRVRGTREKRDGQFCSRTCHDRYHK
jgi:hypothetical protein